ncbi:hypothetical protein PVAP13_9KG171813 [Panicum virgatum]|uniref:Uncharacterized protein n=1 Tax=Panicum virgatum TaxID=38727 RepID=A0A8T0NQW3_PANVG|nr:hypothetical protein PVAP13_9KG171813 [Panicum virgatum]
MCKSLHPPYLSASHSKIDRRLDVGRVEQAAGIEGERWRSIARGGGPPALVARSSPARSWLSLVSWRQGRSWLRARRGHRLPRGQPVPVPGVAGVGAQHGAPGARRRRLPGAAGQVEARRRAVHLERPLLGPHRLQLHRERRRGRRVPDRRLRGPAGLQRVRGRAARDARVEVSMHEDPGKGSSYDVSLVDGYNLPVSVSAVPGTGAADPSRCARDVNAACPPELQVTAGGKAAAVVACKSACLAFGLDAFCCRGVPRQRVLAAVQGRVPGLLQLRVRHHRRDAERVPRPGVRHHLLPRPVGRRARRRRRPDLTPSISVANNRPLCTRGSHSRVLCTNILYIITI